MIVQDAFFKGDSTAIVCDGEGICRDKQILSVTVNGIQYQVEAFAFFNSFINHLYLGILISGKHSIKHGDTIVIS